MDNIVTMYVYTRSAFPKKDAANIALTTVRKWLEANSEKVSSLNFDTVTTFTCSHGLQVQRIIFCTYAQKNWDIYNSLLPLYFPSDQPLTGVNGKYMMQSNYCDYTRPIILIQW